MAHKLELGTTAHIINQPEDLIVTVIAYSTSDDNVICLLYTEQHGYQSIEIDASLVIPILNAD